MNDLGQDEGDVDGASCAFATALSLNTHHAKSLLMLGRLHRKRNGTYDHALALVAVPAVLLRVLDVSCPYLSW